MRKFLKVLLALLTIAGISLLVFGLSSENNEKSIENSTSPVKEFEDNSAVPSKQDAGNVNIGEERAQDGKILKKGTATKVVGRSIPRSTVYVPSEAVYSHIDESGNLGEFDKNGSLVLPGTVFSAVRVKSGASVSDNSGTIVVAAHRSFNKKLGVFANLGNIQPGDLAFISDNDGNIQEFSAVSLKNYYKKDLPQSIFTKDGDKTLVLVTCGGNLYKKADGNWSYEQNIVATFKKVK